ncbi:ketopantoate reductase family protein [Streptomyces sp. NPDC018833]|uniref:ketopantoate reductase family protein n=1 Tax=Streptomyces sp. NPDC018833 TaxID=3365053 RepID=UPI00379F6C01
MPCRPERRSCRSCESTPGSRPARGRAGWAGALDEALTDIAPAVGPGTAVVPLLNGMRHLDELNARFGAARVLGGVAKVQTTLNGAGDIVRLAPGGVLTVGEQDGRSSARVDAVRICCATRTSPRRSRRTSSPRCGTSGSSSARSGR